MSYVYNVYQHPRTGSWGFTGLTSEGDVKAAYIGCDQEVERKSMQPLAVAPAIAKLVRSGYKKLSQPQYLFLEERDGRHYGAFRQTHPDLSLEDCQRVFFATIPPGTSMKAAVSEWRRALNACDGERERWYAHCEQAQAYVPVPSTDAAAALVVAQWAIDNKQPMVPAAGELPAGGPKLLRFEWRMFLQQWFTPEVIDAAFTQLGWATGDAIAVELRSANKPTPEGGVDDSWIAAAAQAAF